VEKFPRGIDECPAIAGEPPRAPEKSQRSMALETPGWMKIAGMNPSIFWSGTRTRVKATVAGVSGIWLGSARESALCSYQHLQRKMPGLARHFFIQSGFSNAGLL
jgi:hypothetical protein